MKTLFKVLAIQVITVFVVIFVFKTVPNIKTAGLLGGVIFLSTSGLNLYLLKTRQLKNTLVFYTTILFVILFVLPMLLSRVYYSEMNFEQIKILGFEAESFHYWSEKFYLVLLLSTVADLIRLKFLKKNKAA